MKNGRKTLRWPITSQESVIFSERIPWFHSPDSLKELAAQRGAFAATLTVCLSLLLFRNQVCCLGEQDGDGGGEGGEGGGGEHPPWHLVQRDRGQMERGENQLYLKGK